MNVLFVIDNMEAGGMQKIVTFLANGMSERGYDVSVSSYASSERHFTMSEKVKFFPGMSYSGGHYTRHIKKVKEVRRVIGIANPDIILCFNSIPTMISILASKKTNIPIVYCERGDPYQQNTYSEKAKNLLALKADWFVFQTENAKKYYPLRVQNRSTVIPNPVTMGRTTQVQYQDRKNEISFVARFDIKQKRQDLMIKAFERIHREHPEIILNFYGSGEDMGEIKQLVNELYLAPNVNFCGTVDNVIELIKYSKLFVLTSDFEGIPNALIEAMSCGVPCVSTDCSPGGARLLIENNVNGLIVPCGDISAIASAANYLLDNGDIAQRMGEKAQHICEKFSPDTILNSWCCMVQQLIDKN